MAIEAWVTVTVLAGVVALLVLTRKPPDIILLGGLTLLLVVPVPVDEGWRIGVFSSLEAALAGFSNEGMLTVAVLFVVVAGLQETGAISLLGAPLLGRPHSLRAAQTRMMLPVAAASAFLNNTPIVAMMIPVVGDWAKKFRLPVSKLLIPLSYATILGGTCTLIGTSTNLVVNGLLIKQTGGGLGMFDIAWVGVPCAVAGLVYLVLLAPRLLPDRRPPIGEQDDPRAYTVEMLVDEAGPLVGRTIEDAGLRHLPGMYLMEIDRDGQILPAVAPTERLRGGDRLVFVGVVESVVDLQKIRGLTPATNQVFKLDAPRTDRCLVEAVVSDTCPLVGRTVREGRFRTRYNAAVIAVARNGQRIHRKIGDIELRAGDTLLLEAHPAFADQQRNSRDFYLVSRIEGSAPPRHERAWISLVLLAALVIVVTAGWLSMLKAAMLAAGLMIITRCCTASAARRSVDWSVLLVIAAAFGIGAALDETGAARAIAQTLLGLAGDGPVAALAVIYLVTMLATAFMTNNAAAVLMFPIAIAAARQMEVDILPFTITVMMAASAEFATPIGYQTNLMVYGAGGYRFGDYLRIGLPLNILVGIVALLVIPRVWPM